MEKENRKGLIYEFPMGVAVLKGGHSLQIDIANAEFMKAIGEKPRLLRLCLSAGCRCL